MVHSVKINEDSAIVALTKEEDHLTFTTESEPTLRYLTCVVIPNGTGVTIANATLSFLLEYSSVQSLVAVIVDNTSSNTDADNCLVVKLEKSLKKHIPFGLHQAELRHIISELGGKTNGTEQPFDSIFTYRIRELFVNSDVITDLSTVQTL